MVHHPLIGADPLIARCVLDQLRELALRRLDSFINRLVRCERQRVNFSGYAHKVTTLGALDHDFSVTHQVRRAGDVLSQLVQVADLDPFASQGLENRHHIAMLAGAKLARDFREDKPILMAKKMIASQALADAVKSTVV